MFTDTNKVDFNYIINKLSEYSRSANGNKDILSITPSSDYGSVLTQHKAVKELLSFFHHGLNIDFHEYENIRNYVIELEKGVILSPISLYNIALTVKLYFDIKKNFPSEKYPVVSVFFTISEFAGKLFKAVVNNINPDGYVESSASKALSSIRRSIEDNKRRSKHAVESFYKEIKQLNYSADDIISVRDGYECVAVKSNYKSQVDGVVVDYSSTGQTAFIVPEAVFKISSELNHLKIEENAEIRRILTEYCTELLQFTHELIVIDREMIKFEVLFAKSRFGINYNCSSPEINKNGFLRLINARHPILGDSAVPLDVEIGNDYKLLLITGPNAGGKTVVIKTVGLFVLMVQSGIPVPASADSSFPIIGDLFVDIGDEQSITDSISTFSGHIKRLKYITDNVKPDSLVLIDELGGGTDPVEGEALAQSVVEYILERGCISLITTHYSKLKHFAAQTDSVENASMEYDEEKLVPKYVLRTGIPGSSRAMDISVRMGLKKSIIERANSLIDKDFIKTEETIRQLEREKQKMSLIIEEMNKEIDFNKLKQEELNKLIDSYNENEKYLKKMINDKKIDFLKEKRSEFEKIIRDIKEKKAEKEIIKQGHAFFDEIDSEVSKSLDNTEITKKTWNKKLEIGDTVLHISSNIKGTVTAVSAKGLTAQFGAVKMECKFSEVEYVKEQKNHVNIAKNYSSGVIDVSAQRVLDIRGLRYDEAEKLLISFVDKAVINGIDEVKIIHGIGTGVLRKCIRDYLEKSDVVQSFDYERVGDNNINYGVTLALIRKF